MPSRRVHLPPTVSNSAADRAGNTYREWWNKEPRPRLLELDDETRVRLIRAVRTIEEYRGMHAGPMTSVTMGIRSMVQTVRRRDDVRPGQRFKRLDRILDKLERYPRMRLSQMEDIGGCRVVLPTIAEVYAVLRRVRHNWSEIRPDDYITNPKADGYRGIHVVKKRGGRLIEIQLRTVGQHEWAEAIESSSPRVGFNLKDGGGPADLREYFKLASDRIYTQEAGDDPDPVTEQAFATLRERVLHYFS
jgi:putative GTP pyrophosphokinase